RTWLIVLAALIVTALLGRRYARRSARRALLRFRARIDRFKLAQRKTVRERLIADPGISAAVRAHATDTGVSEAAAWGRVREYIREIVPFFNVVAYYQIGYRIAVWVLNLFYKVSVEHEDDGALG